MTFGVPDAAAENDDINDTIDYAEVVNRIRAELGQRHFNLLETLGEFVIHMMLEDFKAPWVKISIAKTGIMKDVRQVGVMIERGRSPTA
jgi:dihydroneopterin aldolase